jgi:hypothetical protein
MAETVALTSVLRGRFAAPQDEGVDGGEAPLRVEGGHCEALAAR